MQPIVLEKVLNCGKTFPYALDESVHKFSGLRNICPNPTPDKCKIIKNLEIGKNLSKKVKRPY